MIVKITFLNDEEKPLVMLFGNSYKKWQTQFEEFLFSEIPWTGKTEIQGIQNVEISSAQWVGWGGLKWCGEEYLQQELNREGCQEGEPDNPRPRQYKKMIFKEDSKNDIIARELYDHRMLSKQQFDERERSRRLRLGEIV